MSNGSAGQHEGRNVGGAEVPQAHVVTVGRGEEPPVATNRHRSDVPLEALQDEE